MDSVIENLLLAALFECCEPVVVNKIKAHPDLRHLIAVAVDDLLAFKDKDPASGGRADLIAQGYTSFKAVLHYRLAHWISSTFSDDLGPQAEDIAMVVSSRGKLQSGAEIHHRCRIGMRFVLDHGYGTVIGETVSIGDDCYILNGVILGATGIASNTGGKRHPTIGDRVQIGAFARVFGPIMVGNDVFIGPHSVIYDSIPDDFVITTKSQMQISRSKPGRTA